jgi:hypothetical protein
MSYAKKNSLKVMGLGLGVLVISLLAMWQFYLFVTYKDQLGLVDIQGGRLHLWLAIAMGLMACVAAFFVLSAFAQHDKDDDLHITLNS